MLVTALSDLHGDLIQNINQCDVVCICGDFMPLRMQRNIRQSLGWLRREFLPWCNTLPCKHVLVVSGNHDFVFDSEFHIEAGTWAQLHDLLASVSKKVHLLDNREITIDNVRFWGCPYTTGPQGWANYIADDSQPFSNMPQDADVVLVHQPPYGNVGTVYQTDARNYLCNYGSLSLMKQLLDPDNEVKYLFCGHIHTGQHAEEKIGNTKCFNVSVKDEGYVTSMSPLSIKIEI